MTIDTKTMVSISDANQNFSKVARLGYGLIKNHCMIDGNKRIL